MRIKSKSHSLNVDSFIVTYKPQDSFGEPPEETLIESILSEN